METSLIATIVIAAVVVWAVVVLGILIFMAGCARNWSKERDNAAAHTQRQDVA